MAEDSVHENVDLWQRYSAAYEGYDALRRHFFQLDSTTRVATVKLGIAKDGFETAFDLLSLMSEEELKTFLEELLTYVSYPKRFVEEAENLILSLPREWLMENIERYAEPLLDKEDYIEYSQIGGLYRNIDRQLARRLAERALAQKDEDIREVGKSILEFYQD